jgi:hypothetical protein
MTAQALKREFPEFFAAVTYTSIPTRGLELRYLHLPSRLQTSIFPFEGLIPWLCAFFEEI